MPLLWLSSPAFRHALPPTGRNLHHHHRNVVGTTIAVGCVDQVVANPLRVTQFEDGVRERRLRDHARQAVAAEQEVVSGLDRHLIQFNFDLWRAAQHPYQDVLLLGLAAALAIQQASANMGLHERMVASERLEVVIVPEVGSAVADMRHAGDVIGNPSTDHRRSHL